MSKKRPRKQKKQTSSNKKRYLVIAGIVAAAVPLSILFHAMLGNEPPPIISLGAQPDSVVPSGSCQITCRATDPDGDNNKLSYTWSATGGNISGMGAAANWTAAQEVSIYHVTVVVTDSHGSSATKTLPISVAIEQPPNSEALLVTAEHCYLKESSRGYKVGKGQKYRIECVVSNMSESIYDWSSTSGEISGEGPMITWTAPDTSVDATVTVTVSDVVGNVLSRSVVLEVVECSPCTFKC